MTDYELLTNPQLLQDTIDYCSATYDVDKELLNKYYMKHGSRIAIQEGDIALALKLYNETEYKSTAIYDLMKFVYVHADANLAMALTKALPSEPDPRMYEPLPPELFLASDEELLELFTSLPHFNDYLSHSSSSVIAGLTFMEHPKTLHWVHNEGYYKLDLSSQPVAIYEAAFGFMPSCWTTHLTIAPPEIVRDAIDVFKPLRVDLKRVAKSLVTHQNYEALAAVEELKVSDIKTLGCNALLTKNERPHYQ